MEFNKLQRFGNDPKIPTELPIYQKNIIEAMRNGSFIWQDDSRHYDAAQHGINFDT